MWPKALVVRNGNPSGEDVVAVCGAEVGEAAGTAVAGVTRGEWAGRVGNLGGEETVAARGAEVGEAATGAHAWRRHGQRRRDVLGHAVRRSGGRGRTWRRGCQGRRAGWGRAWRGENAALGGYT